MRKLLCFFFALIITSVSSAQIQRGIVRTPGRENKPSKKIENVAIRLVGAHNDEKSDANGAFSLSLGSSAKNNAFQIGSIRRTGYTIFDKGIKFPKLYPVSNVPIEIVMIKTEDLEREKQEWEERGYKYAEREYQKKLVDLQKQYKNSEEEYNKRLNELEDWYTKYQSLVEGMAEYYVHVDFDKLDKGLVQITQAIADGEYMVADSLISVYAPNLEDEVEQSIKAKAANREQKAFGESVVAKAIADSIEIAKKDERTASYLYAKYTTAISDNRWDDALHNLKLRADLDTTNISAVLDYAFICYNQQRYQESERYLMICLMAYTMDRDIAEVAAIQNSLGLIYSLINKYTDSEKYYKLALENADELFAQAPDSHRALLASVQNNLGLLYKKKHNRTNCEKYFKLALENREVLFQQNQEKYRASLSEIQNNLGNLYSDLHDYRNSEKYYLLSIENKEILISRDVRTYLPDYTGALQNLGVLYLSQRDYTKSEKYLKYALQNRQLLFSLNPDAFRRDLSLTQGCLGDLYGGLQDYSQSEKYHLQALENLEVLFSQNPDAFRADIASAQNNLGNLYNILKDYSKSKEFCEKALENWEILFRQHPDIYRSNIALTQNNLGRVCFHLGDYNNSERLLKTALDKREILYAQNPNIYREDLAMTQSYLGELYFNIRDNENSKKYYTMALGNYTVLFRDQPDSYRADLSKVQNALGSVYLVLQEYQKSAEYLKMSLENKELLFANNPDEYREGLAMLYWNIMLLCDNGRDTGMYETSLLRSLELFKTLYESKPDGYRTYVITLQNILTSKLLTIGNVDEAFKWAENTCSIDTSNKESIYYLAQCYRMKSFESLQNGQYKEAINCIENAMRLTSHDVMLYHNKGEILLMQGKNEEALEMWKKVLELNPNFLDNYPDGTNLSNGLKKLGLIK